MILGYPLLTTLIASDTLTVHIDPLNLLHQPWENPWDNSYISTDSFFDLMENAQAKYLKILKDFSHLTHTPLNTFEEERQTKLLLGKLGSNSYHSGLDCGIPS